MLSFVNGLNIMISSRRFRNSGRKCPLRSFITCFCASWSDIAIFVNTIQQIWRTDIRCHDQNRILKVYRSALRICDTSIIQYLEQYIEYIRMCLFDLIKKNNTSMVFYEQPRSADRLLHILHIPEALRSVGIQNISPYTHSYRYAPYSVHHQTELAASALASSVLPTPVGPRNRNEPIGFVGSLIPALERMIASVTCSYTFILSDDTFVQLIFQMQKSSLLSLSVSLATGMPVHREIILAISSSVTASCTRRQISVLYLSLPRCPAASASLRKFAILQFCCFFQIIILLCFLDLFIDMLQSAHAASGAFLQNFSHYPTVPSVC